MRRRAFLATIGALLAANPARAQRPDRILTAGFLYPNKSSGDGWGKFKNAVNFHTTVLNELGWKVGTEVQIEDASAEGDNARLPALAAALVAKNVDVIWVAGPEAATAAARATTTIPIVFYGVGFPVEQGLVDSLARPGRNITGLTSFAGNEEFKRLELLREIVPGITRLAYLRTDTVMRTLSGKEIAFPGEPMEAVAAKLGFQLRAYRVAKPEDFSAAFEAILADRAQALAVQFTALIFRERKRIADFTNRNRLPSVHGAAPLVEAGGLLHYGANRTWMVRHSHTYVDRILRGARPAELPVELPSKFELVLNLKTAKALGLAIPPAFLIRVDEVIK